MAAVADVGHSVSKCLKCSHHTCCRANRIHVLATQEDRFMEDFFFK